MPSYPSKAALVKNSSVISFAYSSSIYASGSSSVFGVASAIAM